MNRQITLFALLGLIISNSVTADDGWFRFPTALEGKWKIVEATAGDSSKNEYVGQIAVIDGSTIHLRSDNGSNVYRLTFVNPEKKPVEVDLTATSQDGSQTKTFRCLLQVSASQLRLCRPQNDRHSRPRDIQSPDRSETVLTFVRQPASTKP